MVAAGWRWTEGGAGVSTTAGGAVEVGRDAAPMIEFEPADALGRRVLFTPGPVTTSASVRRAVAQDIGSWDTDTSDSVRACQRMVRRTVLNAGERDDLVVTLLPGSGTYGVEAILGSAVGDRGKLLVLSNGMYGVRLGQIAEYLKIPHVTAEWPEHVRVDAEGVARALDADGAITHVAVCHCETTTGVLNRLEEIGPVVASRGKRLLVDAMATLGGYPCGAGAAIDFDACPIDHITASANKCVGGIPGMVFVVSRRAAIERGEHVAHSVSLNVSAQSKLMEATGRFRFTPPTHVLLGFERALEELEAEGGVAARAERFKLNQRVAIERLGAIGIEPLIAEEHRGYVNTSFRLGAERFDALKTGLRSRGYVIFPQKVTVADCFRVGSMGHVGPAEVHGLCDAVEAVLGV